MRRAHEARAENADTHRSNLRRLRQPERNELVVRRLHRPVDLGQRRPRISLEFDLDAQWTGKPAPLQYAEHRPEVDMALADRREVPNAALAALVLEMAVDELRQGGGQIVDRLDAAIEFDVGGIVVEEHVRPADPGEHRNR